MEGCKLINYMGQEFEQIIKMFDSLSDHVINRLNLVIIITLVFTAILRVIIRSINEETSIIVKLFLYILLIAVALIYIFASLVICISLCEL